ncbi:ABC transporter [Bordetella sp. H567]|uniref:ABC transporter ATP-binding protein n=1 Tax=Bordetella sp. H567 TaxID=1697043 RepID=UPI00081C9C5B|nr:ABC transporter ATP-binding protein [Bordetella sp. H567]AOB31435.1 ABC transporter [Bordetella sp. H567]
MTVKLETRGLSKRYGQTLALAPTDLRVESGEFLTLLGPSGSGKTTLLQMIAGLVAPTEGSLHIDGRDATRMPASERGIGLVFQSYALFPHLTVAENVAYPLRMRRVPARRIADDVAQVLAMVQMQEYGERYPHELSGGQQQRVALARCFVYRPAVVLLDEPLGALDKKLREHMQLEIRRLHRELKATFIYVTHDQEEALTMSDRICLMNRARIEQLGTPLELYDRPVSRFAANFLGHSNILEGRLDGDELAWKDRALPLPPYDGATDGTAALLVRPETARLCAPDRALLRGTVSQVVFTGADIRVHVDPGCGFEFLVRSPRDAAPAPGDPVGVTWNPRDAVLLQR